MTVLATQFGQPGKFAAVAVQDRLTARCQQIGKQPLLGGAVLGQVAVVVEVVTRQIGEGGGGDRHAVEAKLGEPVTGRLDRHMLDALADQCGEIAVEPDGVGCRQRAGATAGRRRHSQRAEARRGIAGRHPYLAGEMGDRGLAVGAGDGRDGARLPAVKARRQQRQPPPRIGVGDDGDVRASFGRKIECRRVVGQDRRRPARRRGAGKTPPVEPGAGQCCKQKAGANLARIGGDAGDVGIARRAVMGRVSGPDQLSKLQPACLACFRASTIEQSEAKIRPPAAPQVGGRCARSCGRPPAPPSTRR